MLTFYLIRHGLKEHIPFDPPLSVIGKEQAHATADFLKNIEFKKIFSSPKLRAKQTAEIIAKPHTQEIIYDFRLIERMEWEDDVLFEDFIKEWNMTDNDRNNIPKKGIASHANGVQMKKILEEIYTTYKDGNILIITHGGTIADLLRNLFGEENLPHIISTLTNNKYIDIRECSISTIQKDNDTYTLAKLADYSHLL